MTKIGSLRRQMARCAVAAAVAGCTGGGKPAPPAPAAPDLAVVELCAPKPSPALLARQADEKRASVDCAGFAESIAAGRPAEPPVLPGADAAWRTALGAALRPLAICRAVESDGDAPCQTIDGDGARSDCRLERAFFHAARTAPASHDWRLPDEWLAACRAAGVKGCDAYRDALRSGDPARCPPGFADCAALAAGDPARCGKSAEAGCSAHAERDRLIGEGGLAKLAESGRGEDAVLARAALGRPGACDDAHKNLAAACASAVGRRDGGSPR